MGPRSPRHRQMLAFAHHVADVAEHEQIAGHRARQARDIVGIAGDETSGKTFGKMRTRIRFRHRIADALRQLRADGDALVPRQFSEAVGKVGIVGRQRRLDILRDQRWCIPKAELSLTSASSDGSSCATEAQRRRAPAAQSARAPPCRQPYPPRYPPRPNRSASVSFRKAQCFCFSQHGVPFFGHNGPDERRVLWDDKIVSNLHEQMRGWGLLNQRNPSVWCAAFRMAASRRLRLSVIAIQGE